MFPHIFYIKIFIKVAVVIKINQKYFIKKFKLLKNQVM